MPAGRCQNIGPIQFLDTWKYPNAWEPSSHLIVIHFPSRRGYSLITEYPLQQGLSVDLYRRSTFKCFLNQARHVAQGIGHARWVASSGLGHGRFAAAAAADFLSHHFHQVAGV